MIDKLPNLIPKEPLNQIKIEDINVETMGRAAVVLKSHIMQHNYCCPGGFFASLSKLELANLLSLEMRKNEPEIRKILENYMDLLLFAEGQTDYPDDKTYEEYFWNFSLLLIIASLASTHGLPFNFLNFSVVDTSKPIVGMVTIKHANSLSFKQLERVLIEQFKY